MDEAQIAGQSARYLEQYLLRPPRWSPRPHQVPPPGDWYGWLLNAGRGAGKTATCANYVIDHVNGPPCIGGPTPHWISIIAPTLGDGVTACYSGVSGIKSWDANAKMSQTAGGTVIRWPNGSQAKIFGASTPDDVERLRAGGNSCVVAGTLITTVDGQVPIEQVRPGQYVQTRTGWRRVLRAGLTRAQADVWRVETTEGVLEATGNHEVWTTNGWRQVQFLNPEDTLTACESTTTAQAGTSARTATTPTRTEVCFTATSGYRPTVRSSVGSTFIIGITTDPTIDWRIWNYSRRPSTSACTPAATSAPATVGLARRPGATANHVSYRAPSAGATSRRGRWAVSFGVNRATKLGTAVATSRAGHTRTDCATCAASSSVHPHEATPSGAHASAPPLLRDVRIVRVTPNVARVPVYDLLVADDHEFIANGLLVANCLVWAEELAAWRYLDAAWQQMRFGLRSGKRPRWIASTTPKPRTLIKKLVKDTPHNVVVTHASTDDNPHLEEHVRSALIEEYSGKDIGQQELYAQILDEDAHALWKRGTIEQHRQDPDELPQLARITVGVDPSGGTGEQGIIVAGKSWHDVVADGKVKRIFEGHVLADYSCALSPNGWGRRAVQAAIDYEADDIVVERNFGGDMAIATITDAAEAMGVTIPVRATVASRGKRVRAEPVAALAERGRWHHVGTFPELEDQLCTWTDESDFSPDRLDAMVWTAWHNRLVSVATRGVGKWDPRAGLRVITS